MQIERIAPNFTRIIDGGFNQFWFSYDTLIAFKSKAGKVHARTNDWKTTTGKHLNQVDGGNKEGRLNFEAFKAAYLREFGDHLA